MLSGDRWRYLWTLMVTAPAFWTAGCALPGAPQDQPPLAAFDLPTGSTATRIREGHTIVYAVPDQEGFEFDFFLAQPDESSAEHEMIASIAAAEFGFLPMDNLPAPRTISFTNDLDRGVVGFADESYLLEREADPLAQSAIEFEVRALTAFGEPVTNPTIDPFGDRVAFETGDGRIGTGFLATTPVLTDIVLLSSGVNPVFGADRTLGFSDPTNNDFFVADFAAGALNRFETPGVSAGSFDTPFDSFEVGLTPERIGTFGVFRETTPIGFDPLGEQSPE